MSHFTSASERIVDTMSLDEYLIDNKEATYIVKVMGDSMSAHGILTGDILLVERGRTPRVGEIVVAEEDGEYKLRFFKKGPRIKIEAVVRAVIRKFK